MEFYPLEECCDDTSVRLFMGTTKLIDFLTYNLVILNSISATFLVQSQIDGVARKYI
jgi:hypothetical protein